MTAFQIFQKKVWTSQSFSCLLCCACCLQIENKQITSGSYLKKLYIFVFFFFSSTVRYFITLIFITELWKLWKLFRYLIFLKPENDDKDDRRRHNFFFTKKNISPSKSNLSRPSIFQLFLIYFEKFTQLQANSRRQFLSYKYFFEMKKEDYMF